MREHVYLMVTTLCCMAAHHAAAQEYRVKGCDRPAMLLGQLRGVAQVSYLLDRKGHPDTASLRLVGTDSISLGGARSAATRALSACTMDSRGNSSPEMQSVIQTIRFAGLAVKVSSAKATAALEADFPIVAPPMPTEPVTDSDSLLEERPSELSCERNPRYPHPGGAPDLATAHLNWVTARLIVGIDGRVETGSVVITESSSPMALNVFGPVFAGCRYAPGRISGVAVRTITSVQKSSAITVRPP